MLAPLSNVGGTKVFFSATHSPLKFIVIQICFRMAMKIVKSETCFYTHSLIDIKSNWHIKACARCIFNCSNTIIKR
jgi:hypothetical protein